MILPPTSPALDPVPKLTGADIELANFISGYDDHRETGYEASRLLLGKVAGVGIGARDAARTAPSGGFDCQDWGRKFLTNGSCVYVDLNHLEVCIPEVRSAYDHVAATHAMYRLAARAAGAVNRDLPDGFRLELMANNSDGFGNSYGSHLNFLVARRLWEDLFHRRMQGLLLLASFQASSLILTGQGKVGSENEREPVAYQLAQRADFLEILCGPQTTFNRPMVNSRDEALCGSAWTRQSKPFARLHVIQYDSNLCHTAMVLKVGMLQLVLAMLETGWLDTGLILDRPVDAVHAFSRDPDLQAAVPRMQGEGRVTALDLQYRFLEAARQFVDSGRSGDAVPRAEDLLELWGETLDLLRQRNLAALAPRLDWVLKRTLLEQARQEQDLAWTSPELKFLDHLYSHLDPRRGLYWSMEQAGCTRQLAHEDQIRERMRKAPEDTRAWTRSLLLGLADPGQVTDVDWDRMAFRFLGRDRGFPRIRDYKVSWDNPLEHTRAHTQSRLPKAATLEEIVEALADNPRPGTGPVALRQPHPPKP